MKTLAALLLVVPAWCQPSIDQVMHAATLRAAPLPFSALAQGSLAVAKGSGLGPATLQQASSYPLAKSLAGTSVALTSGGTVTDCLMIYTSDRQIAFIVPSATPLGAAQFTVAYNGRTSAPAAITIVRSNLGIYTWAQDGNGPGIVTDAISGALITLLSPAKPGQFLTVWADGLGPVSGDETRPPTPVDFGGDLTATIGAQPAEITYRGRGSCCTALDQVNLRVPANAPQGCYVPLYFKSESGAFLSNTTTIPVTSDGKPCSDPLGIPSLTLAGKDHVVTGLLLLERNFDRGENGSISTADFAHHIYTRTDQPYYDRAETVNHLGAIAAGTCIVNQTDNSIGYDPLNQTLLDAGPAVTLTLGGNSFRFPHDDFGGYGAFIQGASPLNASGSGSLSNGSGGQVPGFNLSHNTPPLANFQWAEQGTLSSIASGEPVVFTWSGSEPEGSVYLSGGSNTPKLNMSFLCRISGAGSNFTVPADVTRFIPSGAGFLNVTYRRPVAVTGLPPGFDAMRYERQVVRTRGVTFR